MSSYSKRHVAVGKLSSLQHRRQGTRGCELWRARAIRMGRRLLEGTPHMCVSKGSSVAPDTRSTVSNAKRSSVAKSVKSTVAITKLSRVIRYRVARSKGERIHESQNDGQHESFLLHN